MLTVQPNDCGWWLQVILKPSLGYLVTLDPLGFDWRQLDVLFMVLGAMIGQLSDTTVGLHQLQLLFAFQRTCAGEHSATCF